MRHTLRLFAVSLFVGLISDPAASQAGDGLFRRGRTRPVTPTVATRPENQVAPSPMLGTFQPSPYIFVRGNGVAGGGYSPIGFYGGNNSMVLYGPLSSLRATSAPVNTVVRGYDGIPRVTEGTGFSTPNQPDLSPFVYPNRGSNYSALRFQTTAPSRDNGAMWIDQN
jgi:hypothetical protein